MIGKFFFGVGVIILTRVVMKLIVYVVVLWFFVEIDLKKMKFVLEIFYRFFIYITVGFIVVFFVFYIFVYVGV